MLNLFTINNKDTRTGLNDVVLMSLLLALNGILASWIEEKICAKSILKNAR